MHGLGSIDPGRTIDWGRTSEDYARFRPGPPPSFYDKLRALGVGRPDQHHLDLGTGTGVLAREFARRGVARSVGTDVSPEQIEMAKELALKGGVNADFAVAPAEAQPFADRSFDVVTANQCWLYFDKIKTNPEVKRLLKPGGVLVTSHLCWLPRKDEIAKWTEELVLKFNPQWTAGDYSGAVPAFPKWAEGAFRLKGMFVYEEPVEFDNETWRGRIRACRGVGAALPDDQVRSFDAELDRALRAKNLDHFHVLHQIDAHLFEPV